MTAVTIQGDAAAPPSPTGPERRFPGALVAILAAYSLLAVAYGVATPILEAGDENWHEAVVWQIAAGHGLPILNPAEAHTVLHPVQEAGQPPLYYLLAAAATFWIHPPDPAAVMLPSPNAAIGQPDRSAWNKNLFVHGPDEAFPWHGLALAVHLQRLLSTLFGGVTVAAAFALARLAFPGRPAAAPLAAALVAFDPMFLFVSASVDNDGLAIMLSSLTLVALAVVLRRGASMRLAVAVGCILGLATLTKLSAAALALPAGAVFLVAGGRLGMKPPLVRTLLALGGPPFLIAGWWFGRNLALYGDPLGLAMFVRVAGGRPEPLTLRALIAEAPSLWDGFWGVFGIFDISLPTGYYTAARLLLALAGVGLLVAPIQATRHTRLLSPANWREAYSSRADDRSRPSAPAILVLLAGWLALEALLLVRWTAATEASSGRLLFPAITSVTVLAGAGLAALAGRFARAFAAFLAALLAVASGLAIPLAILPAYAAPTFVPVADLRPAIPLGYRYGNLELVGASLPPGPLTPGGILPVTLYWATTGPISANDVVSVQLFGPAGVRVERADHRTDAFPAGGKALTTRWPAGMGLVDRVPVLLRDDIPQPSLVHVAVFVYQEGQQRTPLPARTPAGATITLPEIGKLVYGQAPPPPANPPLGVFGDQIALDAVRLPATAPAGGTLVVGLRWRALTAPAAAYTVFAHVGPPDQAPLAQHDQQPLAGALPTSDWVAGETVDDQTTIPLPATLAPGQYAVTIGLYLPATGVRLPVRNGQQLTLSAVRVTPRGGS